MTYLHMSWEKLAVGKILKPKGSAHTAVDPILEARRPPKSLPRKDSVYLGETEDAAKHGLRYAFGYLHTAEPLGLVERRDSRWVGELQLRHHTNRRIAARARRKLASLSDDDIADKYWAGEASPQPNWEVAAAGAEITGLVYDDPVRVRPPSTGWEPAP